MAQAKRNFNSIKVRLEQVNVADSDAQNLNFNSIKVRLEHPASISFNVVVSFQFHKGAIRTF